MDDYSPALGFLGGAAITIIAFAVIAFLIPMVFYLISLQKAMDAVPHSRRPFPGALVWLSLIPLAGWAWLLVVVIMASAYLRMELQSAKEEGDAGLGVGIAFVACSATSFLVLPGIAAFVLWIIHWVQLAGAKDRLLAIATMAQA